MVGHQDRQQASVVFGYDVIEYRSSTTAMNQFAGNAPSTSSNDKSITTDNINKQCHVQFGEKGKKRDFTISSKLLDPTGELHKYASRLSAEDKDMLAKTSAGFGAEITPFVTSTQLATQWNKEAVHETIRLRNEIRKKTGPRPTRGISYDDDVEYVSEAKSAFENKFKGFKPSVMAESVKNDLRATHFSVGHEKLDYRTSSHIDRLSLDQFALYTTRQPSLHDLKKSTMEIT